MKYQNPIVNLYRTKGQTAGQTSPKQYAPSTFSKLGEIGKQEKESINYVADGMEKSIPQDYHLQGTKLFQYCTCPAGQMTYNFHLSCKHMNLSLKVDAKKNIRE